MNDLEHTSTIKKIKEDVADTREWVSEVHAEVRKIKDMVDTLMEWRTVVYREMWQNGQLILDLVKEMKREEK